MRRMRLVAAIAAALGLNATGDALWSRTVDGYGRDNPDKWLTGADTAVNRLPQADDAVLLSSSRLQAETPRVVIDKNLPAGNIVLESMEGDTVYLQNEVRDTAGWWFYWAFRACGAAGRTLTFRFTNGDPVCTRGPCVSLDQGRTWRYAADSFTPRTFTYTFPPDAREVWFAMGMVYTQRDWEAFLARHAASRAFIETGTLCTSPHGRAVEKARVGCITRLP